MSKKTNDIHGRNKAKAAIAKFFLMGFPVSRIADQTGVPRPTVYKYLDELEGEWEKSWLPAYSSIRTRKVAELANLKSEIYAALLTAQRDGDTFAIAKLGTLIAKIIDMECRIFNIYKENNYTSPLNVEQLIRDYEKEKLDIAEKKHRTPKKITQVEY